MSGAVPASTFLRCDSSNVCAHALEPARHEGVDDGKQEDQRPHQVERIRLDPVLQALDQTHVLVVVAAERRGESRVRCSGGRRRGRTCADQERDDQDDADKGDAHQDGASRDDHGSHGWALLESECARWPGEAPSEVGTLPGSRRRAPSSDASIPIHLRFCLENPYPASAGCEPGARRGLSSPARFELVRGLDLRGRTPYNPLDDACRSQERVVRDSNASLSAQPHGLVRGSSAIVPPIRCWARSRCCPTRSACQWR